ncbi:MAG: ribonuclease R, partial [Limnohabitans sp.]
LRGERTGIRYVIGTRVRVQVSRVDLDGRKIDFRWVQDDALNLQFVSSKKLKGKDIDDKSISLKVQSTSSHRKASKKSRNSKVVFAKTSKLEKKASISAKPLKK